MHPHIESARIDLFKNMKYKNKNSVYNIYKNV